MYKPCHYCLKDPARTHIPQGDQSGLIGCDSAEVRGLVLNKATLRVNCPARKWPLPLIRINEQERVIIFLSEVNSPLILYRNTCKCGQTPSSWGKEKFSQTQEEVTS